MTVKHEIGESIPTTKVMGRPTRYQDSYVQQAYQLCVLGAIDRELASAFAVSEQTINTWKKKYPDFLESINRGKLFADALVAHSLFMSALGSHIMVEEKETINGTLKTTRTIPPNFNAQWFWLKNRQPKYWKDSVIVKEELNCNVFPSTEVLNAISEKALAEAAARFRPIIESRLQRMGITLNDATL
jgi:hypothetical protein